MTKHHLLGKAIRHLRLSQEKSISQLANEVGVDRTYLSKLENGHEKPSPAFLSLLSNHLQVQSAELLYLAGYGLKQTFRTKEALLMQNQIPKGQSIQVNIPDNVQILYTDSVFVTANNFGLVMDIAQSVGPSPLAQRVVARIGMSDAHAKAMIEAIVKHLKNPREEVRQIAERN